MLPDPTRVPCGCHAGSPSALVPKQSNIAAKPVRCVFYVWEVVLVNMWANGSCAWLHTELEQLRAQRIERAPHLQRRVVQLDRWAVKHLDIRRRRRVRMHA